MAPTRCRRPAQRLCWGNTTTKSTAADWAFRTRSWAGYEWRAWFRPRGSTFHASRAGRHIVEGERHRDAGVKADQGDHVGDTDMSEGFDRAVIEALRHPARIGEAR